MPKWLTNFLITPPNNLATLITKLYSFTQNTQSFIPSRDRTKMRILSRSFIQQNSQCSTSLSLFHILNRIIFIVSSIIMPPRVQQRWHETRLSLLTQLPDAVSRQHALPLRVLRQREGESQTSVPRLLSSQTYR